MKILILTGSPSSYSVKRLIEEGKAKGHEMEALKPTDLYPYVSDKKSGYDRLYVKGTEKDKRVLKKSYDAVIPRFAGGSFQFALTVLRHMTENLRLWSASGAEGLATASNKMLTHQRLSSFKVRTLRTVFVNRPKHFKFLMDMIGTKRIVCKTLSGSQGKGVFILSGELSLSTTLGAFSSLGQNLILQRFIDSGKKPSDIRAYVVDGKISAAYRRFSLDEDFRSNYSLSKSGEPIELTEEEEKLAIDAAQAVGLPGLCAVDIIRDSQDDDKPYIVECNGNGSLQGIESVTKHNVARDIIDYVERGQSTFEKYGSISTISGSQMAWKNATSSPAFRMLENDLPILAQILDTIGQEAGALDLSPIEVLSKLRTNKRSKF